MTEFTKQSFIEAGARGGSAGTGKAKKRGSKQYYADLVAKRWKKYRAEKKRLAKEVKA